MFNYKLHQQFVIHWNQSGKSCLLPTWRKQKKEEEEYVAEWVILQVNMGVYLNKLLGMND